MSLRLQAELDKLKAAGAYPGDLAASEIAALVRACDRCDNPFSAANAEAAGFPVKVREGVWLWRLTAGAVVWLDEYASRWWGEDSLHYKWAAVYAMLHARERDAFMKMTDERDAYQAIRAEIMRLPCTEAEIDAALSRFGEEEDARRSGTRPAPRSQPDWRAIAQEMEAGTGIEASVWLWERSARYLSEADRRLRDFAAAHGGAESPRMKDELDRALNALAAVSAGIVRRVKADREAAAAKEAGDGE